MTANAVLEINRARCGETRLVESDLEPLDPSQVRLRVDRRTRSRPSVPVIFITTARHTPSLDGTIVNPPMRYRRPWVGLDNALRWRVTSASTALPYRRAEDALTRQVWTGRGRYRQRVDSAWASIGVQVPYGRPS